MSQDASSHRRILWATSIVGGATLGALVIGLVRNKAVALIGGAEAIGLLGLFTTLVATVAALATLGLDSSAVRLLSQRIDQPGEAGRVRWILSLVAWPMALLGAAAVWLFRAPLAQLVMSDRALAGEVGWLSIGVAASVLAPVQLAVIQSYGRIGDAARVRLWGSVGSTIVGVAAIYRMGIAGIVVAVVSVPLVNYLVALWLRKRLPRSGQQRPAFDEIVGVGGALISLGAAVMLTQTIGNLGALAGRAIVTQKLGLAAAGLYHASNAIVSVNFTLLLNAMVADYYPRVSQAVDDPEATNRVLNEQVHVMLVLVGPALIVVSMAAGVLLHALYSAEFAQAALLFRFFLVANVIRLIAWALGFVLLARGAGASYLLGELAGALFVPATWILVSLLGLSGAGPAAMIWAVAICAVYAARARSFGVRLNRENVEHSLIVVVMLLALAIVFELNVWAALGIGAAGAAALTWRSFKQLRMILTGRPVNSPR